MRDDGCLARVLSRRYPSFYHWEWVGVLMFKDIYVIWERGGRPGGRPQTGGSAPQFLLHPLLQHALLQDSLLQESLLQHPRNCTKTGYSAPGLRSRRLGPAAGSIAALEWVRRVGRKPVRFLRVGSPKWVRSGIQGAAS